MLIQKPSAAKSVIPVWIGALSTTGILGMTVWAGFFSDFSKIIEADLMQDNITLKKERLKLTQAREDLSEENKKIALSTQSLAQQQAELERAISSKESELTTAQKKLEIMQSQQKLLGEKLLQNQLELLKHRLP